MLLRMELRFLLLVVALFASLISSIPSSPSTNNSNNSSYVQRSVKSYGKGDDGHSIIFRSAKNDANANGVIRVALNIVAGMPSIRVGYYVAVNETSNRTGDPLQIDDMKLRHVFSFRTHLFALVEKNERFGELLSPSRFSFLGQPASKWTPWQVTKITDGLNQVSTLFIDKANKGNSLTVNISLLISSSMGQVDPATGMPIHPMRPKFSITVRNFNYQLANSKLALAFALVAYEDVANRSSIVQDARAPFSQGSLNWDKFVMADGRNVSMDVSQYSLDIVRSNASLSSSSSSSMGGADSDDHDNDGRSGANRLPIEKISLLFFTPDAVQPNVIDWDPEMQINEQQAEAAAQGTISSYSYSYTSDAKHRTSMSLWTIMVAITFTFFFAL